MTQKDSNQSEDTESVKTAKLPEKQGMSSNYTDDLPIKDDQTPLTPQCKPDSNSVWPAEVEEHDIPESKEEEDGDTKIENGKAKSQSSKKGEKEFPKRTELVLSMSKHIIEL